MKKRRESKSYGTGHYQDPVSVWSSVLKTYFSGKNPVLVLTPSDSRYPAQYGAGGPPLYLRGECRLLDRVLVGVFASIKSSGKAILGALAWARGFSESDSVVISGFHAPLEQECLTMLLTRGVPVIVCPAREIETYRITPAWIAAIEAGKMLLLSRFESERRITRDTSDLRNDLVARLSASLVILSLSKGGHIESLAQDFEEKGKPVHRLLDVNSNLK